MNAPLPPQELQDDEVDAALQRAARLVASASGMALALDAGGIELPPVHAGQVDAAQLRAIATLYLAAELESTGLISTVERLASLLRSGALAIDVGAATPLLMQFWQERNQRASEAERNHCYASLFGNTGAGSFDEAMLALCEALYKLDDGIGQQARMRQSANILVDLLLANAGSITVFMAQEVLQSINQALNLLKHRALQAAFGARDVWTALAQVGRMTHAQQQPAPLFVARGKAGLTVLAWLADHAQVLAQPSAPKVALDHPVIGAAEDWMQAALRLGEAGTEPVGRPPLAASAPASPWTTLTA